MLHSAIMTLASYSLSDRHMTEQVKPQTDSEVADAQAQSLGAYSLLLQSYFVNLMRLSRERPPVEIPRFRQPQGPPSQEHAHHLLVYRERLHGDQLHPRPLANTDGDEETGRATRAFHWCVRWLTQRRIRGTSD